MCQIQTHHWKVARWVVLVFCSRWPNEVETSDGICPTSWLWFLMDWWRGCRHDSTHRGRWEFDIFELYLISPPTRSVYDSRRYPSQRYESKGVCVCVFFSDFQKNKGKKNGESATHFSWPDWWDVLFGLLATRVHSPPMLVTDQRLRWPTDTAGGKFGL